MPTRKKKEIKSPIKESVISCDVCRETATASITRFGENGHTAYGCPIHIQLLFMGLILRAADASKKILELKSQNK